MKNKTAVLFLILVLPSFQSHLTAQEDPVYKEVQVGVILDMGSWVGKIVYSCITMAISDFYAANSHYRTRLVLQMRDTKGEPLSALSAAATPKQIYELMQVDGLTNDEMKSHLQVRTIARMQKVRCCLKKPMLDSINSKQLTQKGVLRIMLT